MPGRAASFSAELLETRDGQTQTTRFNFQDKSYRYELVLNGQTLVVTVDGKSGILRMLLPGEKMYREAGPDADLVRFIDPFSCYAYYARSKDVQAEGTESIAGFPCTKRVVSGGGQVFVTGWWSEELGFPLRVLTNLDSRTLELRNIKPGPQDPALFALPAGYKLIEEEKVPVPEWAGQIAGAPVLSPPFERTLAEGAILRMRPQAGRKISLTATNPGRETSTLTAIGFKDGRPRHDPGMSTASLEPGQSLGMVFADTSDEADEIIIRISRKSVKIKTTLVAAAISDQEAANAAAMSESSPPVAAPEASAELSAPASAEIATQIEVVWQGPANRDDYICIARPDQPPGSFVNRTSVREGSPLKVWTPSDPGPFEVRYILQRGSKVLAQSSLEIRPVAATVATAGPVAAAAWIEAKWTGPARAGDFLSVAAAGQQPGAYASRTLLREGNPLKLRAPSDPGDYEVRYILARGTRVLAKAPVTIGAVTAEVRAPASAKGGAVLAVEWRGPGYPEDFISVARLNQPAGSYLASVPARKGNPSKLAAPKEPGTYEVRYVLGRGNRLLAKAPLTIEAP